MREEPEGYVESMWRLYFDVRPPAFSYLPADSTIHTHPKPTVSTAYTHTRDPHSLYMTPYSPQSPHRLHHGSLFSFGFLAFIGSLSVDGSLLYTGYAQFLRPSLF